IFGFDADPHKPVLRIPRRRRNLHRRRDRVWSGRLRIRVAEVVDHLFNAHGILRRPLILRDESPHVRVRRRIDITRERRQRLLAGRDETVVGDRAVGLVICWQPRNAIECHSRQGSGSTKPLTLLTLLASLGLLILTLLPLALLPLLVLLALLTL